MSDNTVILEVKELHKSFDGHEVLKGISTTIKKGDVLALIGPSGCGKSTFLRSLNLLEIPTAGHVLFEGTDLTDPSVDINHVREKIGMVFQQFHLIPYLTAVENLMVAQYYHSIPDKKEAMEALARVGLEDRAGHLPSELSGGEQQRVCIARALINYPVLILADEPTGNLDEKNEKLVMNLFRELNEEGHTIITVTHSDHVGKAAKRIVIIEHGHMREGGEEEKA